jgi:hypothetical protein
LKLDAVTVFLVIILFAIKFPLHRDSGLLDLALLVTPVLFSIFVAFSISERLSRVDKIRENDSEERASLIMLNTISRLLPNEKHKHINELIDTYLIATMDYVITDYYKTYANYEDIAEYLLTINKVGIDQELRQLLEKILRAREQTVSLISDRLSSFEWTVYSVLGIGVILPFLVVNTGTFLAVLLIGILTTSVLLILFFLYKLDSISWKRSIRIIEPYQKTFESIGQSRYFPELLLSDRSIKKLAGVNYRVGHFPHPYPDLSGKDIEYVNGKKTELKPYKK